MKPYDPENAPPEGSPDAVTSSHPEARATGAGTGCCPREIALDFPVGDGRTGRCHVRLFQIADEDETVETAAIESGASGGYLTVALVEAPPGGGGFHLSLYAAAIATALCERQRILPDRLLYIDHDRDAGARMSEWAILLGPQALYAYSTMVSEGSFSSDTFHLVAFDFEAGVLVRPRFTSLSRLDVETFTGGPIES